MIARVCRLFAFALCLGLVGCASQKQAASGSRIVEPENYIIMVSGASMGILPHLRVVDWGDEGIYVHARDEGMRERVGYMSRSAFHQFADELTALGALELEDFENPCVFDCDFYDIELSVNGRRHALHIHCPWTYDTEEEEEEVEGASEGAADSDEQADSSSEAGAQPWAKAGKTREEFFARCGGSKPHEKLVVRFLEEVEKDYLRWDTSTRTFDPDRQLVDTGGEDVADAYFTDDGELLYGVETIEWIDGEEFAHITWHSADREREPEQFRFIVYRNEHYGGEEPYPRPTATIERPKPSVELQCNCEHEGRLLGGTFCDGQIGLYAGRSNGLDLIVYSLAHPKEHCSAFRFDDVEGWDFQIDVSPDGRRAAWIDKGRLYTAEAIRDCDGWMARFEKRHASRLEYEAREAAYEAKRAAEEAERERAREGEKSASD